MNDIRKTQALASWEKLFSQPEIRMDAEEQYEALLHLADECSRRNHHISATRLDKCPRLLRIASGYRRALFPGESQNTGAPCLGLDDCQVF
jgi:hypothetical protein